MLGKTENASQARRMRFAEPQALRKEVREMKRTTWGIVLMLTGVWVMLACSGEPRTAREEPAGPASAVEEASFPDPGPEEAKEVEEFVRQWVGERAGEGNVYDIPPRAGQEVAGVLTGFHTVHQEDADTYYVCVDFVQAEDTYDIDFFIDRTAEGLTVSEHHLHKVNGEAVE